MGEQETEAQGETWEAQVGDKEKPFPYEGSPAVELGPEEVGLSPAL